MSLSEAVVRLGYQYVAAMLREVELCVDEPSWFRAFVTTQRAHEQLRGHTQGLAVAIDSQRPRSACEGAEGQARELGHHALQQSMAALLQAVHDRQVGPARDRLNRLRVALEASMSRDLALVVHAETLGGDLSQVLARAIQQRRAAR